MKTELESNLVPLVANRRQATEAVPNQILGFEFLRVADTELQRSLDSVGFKRVGAGIWNRRDGANINVIGLQKHSVESLLCVTLGIHYEFLPKAGVEIPLTENCVEPPDCEIKLRLTANPTSKDQWWQIASESVFEIAALLKKRGLTQFDSYRLDGPIATMEVNDIEAGNLGLLSSLTKIRACLLTARMYEYLGDRKKCVSAATSGMKVAGLAVGPKRALKEILRRNGHSL